MKLGYLNRGGLPRWVHAGCAWTALVLCSEAWASPRVLPPGSFVRVPVPTIESLCRHAASDPVVMRRYQRFFRRSNKEVLALFRSLRLSRLGKPRIARVFFMRPGEIIRSRVRLLRRGLLVFAHTDGDPVLIAACGNPVMVLSPPMQKIALGPAAAVPEYSPWEPLPPAPEYLDRPVAAASLVASTVPLGLVPPEEMPPSPASNPEVAVEPVLTLPEGVPYEEPQYPYDPQPVRPSFSLRPPPQDAWILPILASLAYVAWAERPRPGIPGSNIPPPGPVPLPPGSTVALIGLVVWGALRWKGTVRPGDRALIRQDAAPAGRPMRGPLRKL